MKKRPSGLDRSLGCEQFIGLVESITGSKAYQEGSEVRVRCPSHLGSSASLSVKQTGERLLLWCYAGCTVHEICKSVGISVGQLFSAGTQVNEPRWKRERRQIDKAIIFLWTADRKANRAITEADKKAFRSAQGRIEKFNQSGNKG